MLLTIAVCFEVLLYQISLTKVFRQNTALRPLLFNVKFVFVDILITSYLSTILNYN